MVLSFFITIKTLDWCQKEMDLFGRPTYEVLESENKVQKLKIHALVQMMVEEMGMNEDLMQRLQDRRGQLLFRSQL
jgi:hypothetical protein